MMMMNEEYDKEILQICQTSPKTYPQILKSKKYKHLWSYILSCTQMLQDKEIETGHKYRISTFVNWTLKHRTRFETCKICDKPFYFYELSFESDYPLHCCIACINKDPDHIKAVSDTLERRYGKRFPAQVSEFFQKMGDTCEKLYGVRNYWQTQMIKDINNDPVRKAKRLKTLKAYNQDHYGVDWFVQSDKFKEMTKTTNGTSKEEKSLVEWLKTFVNKDDILVGSFKIISPQQLDVYIPSKKMGIEFNGTYYHSIERNIDMKYHLMKTQRCEDVGVHLIHIWENDWIERNDAVKTFIKNAIEGSLNIDLYLKERNDGFLEVDRSKFNKCSIPSCYEIVDETEPEIVIRSKNIKDKYKVPDCGKLILKKINL